VLAQACIQNVWCSSRSVQGMPNRETK
jgi:hypothetical protein